MVKYILHGGWITSRTDGQHHFVPAHELAFLYGVDIRECVRYPSEYWNQLNWKDPEGAIHLYPRSDGIYIKPFGKGY